MPKPEFLNQQPQGAAGPKAIDLFCGAGGLSLGLKQAGFQDVLAVDNWRRAQETYLCNFPGVPFLLKDLNQVSGTELLSAAGVQTDEIPTLIAGGPPCQGFSSAGRREAKDPRNTLVGTFARLVAEVRPHFFFFENVEGFITTGRGAAVVALLDPIFEAGYQIHLRKINAANYGVPQLRKRVIALGALGMIPSFPAPTHSAYGAPGAQLTGRYLPPTPTLQDAIGGLGASARLDGQICEPLEALDLQRCVALEPGQTMRDLPIHLQHESYSRRANRRVRDGMPTERRGGAPAGLRKLRLDHPSKAITGSAISEFLHPYVEDFLTIRECAMLQTFPDDFQFVGTKSEKALLIGNAVPPHLAKIFGRSLLGEYQGSYVNKTIPQHGKLVSFTPTLSMGMSPVLSQVVLHVNERYGMSNNQELGTQLTLHA